MRFFFEQHGNFRAAPDESELNNWLSAIWVEIAGWVDSTKRAIKRGQQENKSKKADCNPPTPLEVRLD